MCCIQSISWPGFMTNIILLTICQMITSFYNLFLLCAICFVFLNKLIFIGLFYKSFSFCFYFWLNIIFFSVLIFQIAYFLSHYSFIYSYSYYGFIIQGYCAVKYHYLCVCVFSYFSFHWSERSEMHYV